MTESAALSNKEKIIAAAAALLLEKGVRALNVRAIADRAGLSTIGIYSHFKGKQGILDELYIAGFGYVKDAVATALKVDDPRDAILHGVRNYVEMAEDHQASYRLIFGETNADYSPSDEARSAGLAAFNILVTLVARILPDEASTRQKQSCALEIWAVAHGFVSIRDHAIRGVLDVSDWSSQTANAATAVIDSWDR